MGEEGENIHRDTLNENLEFFDTFGIPFGEKHEIQYGDGQSGEIQAESTEIQGEKPKERFFRTEYGALSIQSKEFDIWEKELPNSILKQIWAAGKSIDGTEKRNTTYRLHNGEMNGEFYLTPYPFDIQGVPTKFRAILYEHSKFLQEHS